MPIQATFQADFTDFQRAVEQADVSLRGLETNAAKVEGSLNRMVDSFSGRKVISEATLMVEAVERIGGASKLTEAELARVSATAAQAAEKMRALGVEVPPGMQELADRTKHVGEETSKTTKLLGALAGQLAAMFTVSSVIAFGKAILDNADAVQKMADQTGLLTDEVQALMYISGQTGTSTDALTSAMQKLNEGFGSGDRGLVAAVRHLGLELRRPPHEKPVCPTDRDRRRDRHDRRSRAAGGVGVRGVRAPEPGTDARDRGGHEGTGRGGTQDQ